MTRMGMDVDEVERLGGDLQKQAARIEAVTQQIDGLVRTLHTTWHGRDAEAFVTQAWPQHRNRLQAAGEQVKGLGQSALNNARAQRQVSQQLGSSAPAPRSELPGWFVAPVGVLVGGLRTSLGTLEGLLTDDMVLDRNGLHGGTSTESRGGVSASAEQSQQMGGVTFTESGEVFDGVQNTSGTGWTIGPSGVSGEAYARTKNGLEAVGTLSAVYGIASLTQQSRLFVGDTTGASAKAGLGPDGLSASVSADASRGISVSNTRTATVGVASVSATETAFAGGRVSADAGVGLGPDGAKAHVSAGGLVGGEVTATAAADVGGAHAGVTGHAIAGLAAEGSATATVTASEIKLHAKLSIAVGVGIGIEPDISIKPQEVVKNLQHLIPW